mmetsp:Transcript_173131/g.555152  ORF Transcript_173131/g.555152 Transcript_173131/m.555152 type:complete len:319 (+) Transcript_173131:77-1033(+)
MELQQCGARCTSGFAIESTEAGVSALGVQNARVEIADGPRADRSSTQFEQPIGDVVVAVADADVAEVPPGGAEKGGEGKGGAPHQVDQKQPQPAPRRSRRWLRCCCSSKKPQRAIASFSLRLRGLTQADVEAYPTTVTSLCEVVAGYVGQRLGLEGPETAAAHVRAHAPPVQEPDVVVVDLLEPYVAAVDLLIEVELAPPAGLLFTRLRADLAFDEQGIHNLDDLLSECIEGTISKPVSVHGVTPVQAIAGTPLVFYKDRQYRAPLACEWLHPVPALFQIMAVLGVCLAALLPDPRADLLTQPPLHGVVFTLVFVLII